MKFWFLLIFEKHIARVSIGIILTWLTMASGVALLMLSGWFITATTLTGIGITAGLIMTFDMYVPGSGIRFFALSRTISRYVERIYNHDTILRLIALFRVTLFGQLVSMPLSNLRLNSDSEWLGRLTADIDALDSILIRYIIPPIATLLLIITISLFLSTVWVEFALYAALFMLLTLSMTIQYTIRSTSSSGQRVNTLLNQLRVQVIDHLNGVIELQSFNVMERHQVNIDDTITQLTLAQSKLDTKTAQLQTWLEWLLQLNLFIVVICTLNAFESKIISGPEAVMIVMLFLGTNEIFQSLITQFSTWGKTHFAAHRLSTLQDPTTAIPNIHKEIDNVTSIDVKIIDQQNINDINISLSLKRGQCINVIGQSGSGKSSLADLLAGVVPINEKSRYIINGSSSLEKDTHISWYQKIGYLEQSNTILAGSLGYNLTIGISEVEEERVWKVLNQLELDQWANGLPEGLNTWLGESGYRLSGGQARRICLARILLRNPQMIVLDEPFNGLDDNMAARIWRQITPWLSSKIVVLLTHEKAEYIDIDNSEILSLTTNIDNDIN